MLLRRRLLAFGLAAICCGASCGIVGFDVEEAIPEQVVSGSPLGGLLPLALFQIPLEIDLEARTKAQGTGPAHSAHLKAITLQIISPEGATFAFIDNLVVKVVAEGLPEREVARLDKVPAAGRIDLVVVGDVDLLPYINKGATLRASATGRMPSQDTRFGGKVVIRVKV